MITWRILLYKHKKPHVENIDNLTAAVVVDQSPLGGNIRSTSFNSTGACPICAGKGVIVTELAREERRPVLESIKTFTSGEGKCSSRQAAIPTLSSSHIIGVAIGKLKFTNAWAP